MMVETYVIRKLFRAFPNFIINHPLEFVADVNPRVNSYFCLSNCESEEDVQAKVLEWLSRDAFIRAHITELIRRTKRFIDITLTG